MYSLFLDIAFHEGVFALFQNGLPLETKKTSLLESRQPTRIFDAFLKNHSLSLQDISYIACGIGPGSYTGIRSASAIARGISFSTNLKIVGIPSLLLLAPEKEGSFLLLAKGGVGGIYSQHFSYDGVRYQFKEPALCSLEEIKKYREGQIVASSHEWLTEEGLSPLVVESNVNIVGRIALDLYRRGEVYTAQNLPLLYLRKTQPEIEKANFPRK